MLKSIVVSTKNLERLELISIDESGLIPLPLQEGESYPLSVEGFVRKYLIPVNTAHYDLCYLFNHWCNGSEYIEDVLEKKGIFFGTVKFTEYGQAFATTCIPNSST